MATEILLSAAFTGKCVKVTGGEDATGLPACIFLEIYSSPNTHTLLGQSRQVNLHTAKQRARLTATVKTIFQTFNNQTPGQYQPLFWESDGADLSEFKRAEPISYPSKTTQQQYLP